MSQIHSFMLLKEKKKEENVQLDVSVERTIITIGL